ncbi:hypothetical protein Tco_1383134 [Tanacetum coccineum]
MREGRVCGEAVEINCDVRGPGSLRGIVKYVFEYVIYTLRSVRGIEDVEGEWCEIVSDKSVEFVPRENSMCLYSLYGEDWIREVMRLSWESVSLTELVRALEEGGLWSNPRGVDRDLMILCLTCIHYVLLFVVGVIPLDNGAENLCAVLSGCRDVVRELGLLVEAVVGVLALGRLTVSYRMSEKAWEWFILGLLADMRASRGSRIVSFSFLFSDHMLLFILRLWLNEIGPFDVAGRVILKYGLVDVLAGMWGVTVARPAHWSLVEYSRDVGSQPEGADHRRSVHVSVMWCCCIAGVFGSGCGFDYLP